MIMMIMASMASPMSSSMVSIASRNRIIGASITAATPVSRPIIMLFVFTNPIMKPIMKNIIANSINPVISM